MAERRIPEGLADAIVESIRQPLLVLDHDLQVQSANQAFYAHFQVSPEETEGHLIYDLGNGQWDIPRLRELLENVLHENDAFDDYEVEHDFPVLGRRIMILNARRINHLKLISLAIEDATEQQMAVRRRQFLIDLNDTISKLEDADEIAAAVNATVAEHLRVSRAAYGQVDLQQQRATVLYRFHDDGSPVRRDYALEQFGPELVAALQTGRPLIVRDVQDDPRTGAWAEAFLGLDVRALLCIPVLKEGRLDAFFVVAHREPRVWPDADVALVEQMAERTRSAVEQARAECAVRESESRYRALAETLEQRVAKRTGQLRGLAARLTRAEEQERRRLAEVLHDHLQQILIAGTMRVAVVREEVADPAIREHLQMLTDLLNEAIDATRSLSVELAPPVLHEQGLPKAIEWLAGRLEEQHGLPVEVEADPTANPTREETQHLLFQAGRELLLNIVKHAETDRAWIRLARHGDAVRLEVMDRGAGFDPSQVESTAKSFGLFHVRERLEAIEGQLAIDAAPGRGTRIVVTAPDS